MKYIKISIVILLVSFISIFAYKLTTNNSNNKISLTKEQMKEMLSYTIDGNSTSSMPTKGSGYKVKSITCKSGSILTWDNDNWLLEVEKLESEDLCNIDFTTGTGSYTVTAVPSIAGSLDSTSKSTTENGQVTFYTKLVIDSVSGCTNEISDGKIIIKNVTSNTTCNINLKFPTLATLIKEKSITHEDGIYEENGYRYEGSDPNNYIYMVNNGSNELWRIIGLFPDGENGEDVIRVRKVGYETAAYDNGNHTTAYFNNTSKTNNKLLAYSDAISNKNYIAAPDICTRCVNHWPKTTLYTTLSSTYTLANYKNTVNYKMYLGGAHDISSYKSQDLYDMERMLNNKGTAGTSSSTSYNSTTIFTGSVGLMYPSDYGYAVLSSDCARTIKIYYGGYDNTAACHNNNWLYQGSNSWQWLISPNPSYDGNAFSVNATGPLDSYKSTSFSGPFSPVMALKADVVVTGSGTNSDPYVMK